MARVTRRGLLRGMIAGTVTAALPSAAQPVPAAANSAPAWAEEWPPSAHPAALLVAIPTDQACPNCGQCHGYMTKDCLPCLFGPGAAGQNPRPGEQWSEHRPGWFFAVPQPDMICAQLLAGSLNWRVVKVRQTAWQFMRAPLDPYQDDDPLVWPGVWERTDVGG